MLYSLMKKVMWSLMGRSLLSYTGKIKHKSPSVWIWHQHIYPTKVVFHVMVVKGQILSLCSQTHVLSLSWDPGHYRWIYLLCQELLSLGSSMQFFKTSWIGVPVEQIWLASLAVFCEYFKVQTCLASLFPMKMVTLSVDLIIVQIYKSVLEKKLHLTGKIPIRIIRRKHPCVILVGSFQHRIFYDYTIQRGNVSESFNLHSILKL